MLREGKNHEAISYLKAQRSLSPKGQDYLCDAYFQSRDWKSAYDTLRVLMASGAVTPYNRKLEAKILSNWGRYEEALSCIKAFLADHGDDIEANVTAKTCNFNLGNHEEALRYGQKAIVLKDRLANADSPKPRPIHPNKTGRRVISFSVWGTRKAYILGAAINIELARAHFPEWCVRIYAAASIESELIELFRRLALLSRSAVVNCAFSH